MSVIRRGGMRVRSYVFLAVMGLLGAGPWLLLGSGGAGGSAGPGARAVTAGPGQPETRRLVRPRLPGSHTEAGWPEPSREPPGAGSDTVVSDRGEDILVTRALVHAALVADLPRAFPALELSSADLARLSSVMLRVRARRLRLRQLAHTRESSGERRRLQRLLVAELLAIEDITGVSAVELTGALSDQGITTEEEDDVEPVYTLLPAQ